MALYSTKLFTHQIKKSTNSRVASTVNALRTHSTARRLSALAHMGFERVDAASITMRAARIDRRTYRVAGEKPAMGTLAAISALDRSQARLEEGIGRAFEEMERLIALFSRCDGASAVTELNARGLLEGAPPEFAFLIERSREYHHLSAGAFDITVEPLVELFREGLDGARQRSPTQAEIRDALELTGVGNIELDNGQARFKRSGMGITLDGIAKGYIVDAVAEVLRKHKIKRYLIDAGGDIRAAGTKERKLPWTVAVQDPGRRAEFPDTIHLIDAAVATSGGYEIYFDQSRRTHHIVNAGTGRSPDMSVSVSVVAPAAMLADALATGAFVMDPRRGVGFIDAVPGCECLIIDRDGRQLKSRGWRSAAAINGEKVE